MCVFKNTLRRLPVYCHLVVKGLKCGEMANQPGRISIFGDTCADLGKSDGHQRRQESTQHCCFSHVGICDTYSHPVV